MVPAMNRLYDTPASPAEIFDIVSPVDGRTVATQAYLTSSEADAALCCASAGFREWRAVPLAQRIRLTQEFVAALMAKRDSLADLVMWLIGRPIQQSDEMARVGLIAEQLIAHAKHELIDLPVDVGDGVTRFVRREPKGVCLAICAWNYPVAMAAGMSIAALLAGNAVMLKHAPQTMPIANFLADAWVSVGGSPEVFQSVPLDHASVERLLGSGDIHCVQFIGSDVGGRAVYRAAAAGFATTGLELGGKDPAYVRVDADLAAAIPELVGGSFGNAGQSCCSVERIYVQEAIYDRFVEQFVDAMRKLRVGDSRDGPDVGPVVSVAAAKRIREQIAHAVSQGAVAVTHGADFSAESPYVAPTVLLHVPAHASAVQDETFGPVVVISRVSDDVEAIKRMNDSRYGLTASIWTRDTEYAVTLAREVTAGVCYVNRCDHADMNLPWGGVKTSGIGRTYGAAPFDEYTVKKGFHVNHNP